MKIAETRPCSGVSVVSAATSSGASGAGGAGGEGARKASERMSPGRNLIGHDEGVEENVLCPMSQNSAAMAHLSVVQFIAW